MTNAESKYNRTAVRMNHALLELLSTKEYTYITVKEICQKAGVNRTTFYLHYESISDLLEETLAYANSMFRSSFPVRSDGLFHFLDQVAPGRSEASMSKTELSVADLEKYGSQMLSSYLEFVRSNRTIILAAYNNPTFMQMDIWMDSVSRQVLDPLMKQHRIPEAERIYRKNYYQQGIQAIIRTWVQMDCSTPTEELVQIILRCILPDKKPSPQSLLPARGEKKERTSYE